jgi:ATP-dependent exoDNAse (exonuclease V) alpha subunit
MFAHGQVIGVAFTGAAARKLHETVGTGVTAHRIIDAWRHVGCNSAHPKYDYGKKRVLVVDESSTMSIRLFRLLLEALGPSLRRIYICGDYRQMPPVGGGSSLAVALMNRYNGTPLSVELNRSMRVTDASGSFLRNLNSICTYNGMKKFVAPGPSTNKRPSLYLEWSDSPDSQCPFVFIHRGSTEQESVEVIRDALRKSGMDPDDEKSDYQIVVHTNDRRKSLGRHWYNASPIHQTIPEYREHEFRVGEQVMFLENNYGCTLPKSEYNSEPVMNGTIGVIADIFDEDTCAKEKTLKKLTDTADPQSSPDSIRWIHIAAPVDALICLSVYKKENIVRAQPATVAKMQGGEAKIVVVYLDDIQNGALTNYTRCELYTACSRGKERCIIVGSSRPPRDQEEMEAFFPPPEEQRTVDERKCPDATFEYIVANTSVLSEHTRFYEKFTEFSKIDDLTKTTPTMSHSRARTQTARQKRPPTDDS